MRALDWTNAKNGEKLATPRRPRESRDTGVRPSAGNAIFLRRFHFAE
jgi:hypothetical protein